MVFMERRIRKMDDETKKWLTFDHSKEEKESLLKQVVENEAKNAWIRIHKLFLT